VAFWDDGYGLCQPGVFFRRDLLEQIGYLDPELHYAMDYDFWLRVARRHSFKIVDQPLARYIVHPASKTGQARFGSGFNEELERISRAYWGAPGTRRHRRFARGCNRFFADCCANAIVCAHKNRDELDWAALRRMVQRRPMSLFGRHMIAVACERMLGVRAWNRLKRTLGYEPRDDDARPS
jgi:GT2 family glycosyltransferase